MKPIIVLDSELKENGELLCGKCRKPVIGFYAKGHAECPHCGAVLEDFAEGEELLYAQRDSYGYMILDKKERARLEKELESDKRIAELGHVYTSLETFLHKDNELEPLHETMLKEAFMRIKIVLKKMENSRLNN